MRRAPKQAAIFVVADSSGIIDVVRDRATAISVAQLWARAEPEDAPAKVYRYVFKLKDHHAMRSFDPCADGARARRARKAKRG